MYSRKTKSWIKHLDFILLDIFCLQGAFVLAYITRHGFANPYSEELYRNMAVVYALLDLVVLITNSSMKNVLKRGFYKEILCTVKHGFLVVVTASIFLFTVQYAEEYSRLTFYLTGMYYLVLSYAVRSLWKAKLKDAGKRNSASAYIVTTTDRVERIVSQLKENGLGLYTFQGICLLDRDAEGEEILGVPVNANKTDLLDYLCDKWVDEVFVSIPVSGEYPEDVINGMTEMGLVVHICVEQLRMEPWQHQTIEKVAGLTARTLSMTMATPQEQFWKRALDIVGGIVGCAITVLLTLVIGPLIYIKSPGPIFFTQTRVGKNGRKFKMYKFRSMYLDAEAKKAELMAQNRVQGGLMFKLDYDPRIIGCERKPDGTIRKGIGNFIRDYSLDEFPQFFNVLKGDLSLCGTRPPTVDEWEKYELHHRARLAIKPGITGLWQVSGRSNITDFEEVVELDKKYIREWSMGLDLRILLKTVLVVLGKDGSM